MQKKGKNKSQKKDLIIGVDIGGTNIKAGLFYGQKILKYVTTPTLAELGRKKSQEQLFTLINQLFSKNVFGIGIGFPAPVVKGQVYQVNNLPGWSNTNIQKLIEEKYKVRCIVENDANCFTLAQAVYGPGQKKKIVVGVTLGTGIGSGIVINKKIISGNSGAAGEIGKIILDKECVEYYTRKKFFYKKLKMSPKEAYFEAKKGNKHAKQIFKEFGKNVGKGLSMIVNLIDPEIIVLGGNVTEGFELFEKEMNNEIKKLIYTNTFKNLKIVKTNLKYSSVKGAACLIR